MYIYVHAIVALYTMAYLTETQQHFCTSALRSIKEHSRHPMIGCAGVASALWCMNHKGSLYHPKTFPGRIYSPTVPEQSVVAIKANAGQYKCPNNRNCKLLGNFGGTLRRVVLLPLLTVLEDRQLKRCVS